MTGGGVYLTGDQRSGCVVAIDNITRTTGASCGNRPQEADSLISASLLGSEPCGVVVILAPDGYTALDQPRGAARSLAQGQNVFLLAGTNAHQVVLQGPGIASLHLAVPALPIQNKPGC